mmetsp:Transcript_3630/g.9147  ORF Transcript_3630/g.9147 Transcript_3630/m.9147 type:complete len:235 (-) Transcript_3630:451-1155(-)
MPSSSCPGCTTSAPPTPSSPPPSSPPSRTATWVPTPPPSVSLPQLPIAGTMWGNAGRMSGVWWMVWPSPSRCNSPPSRSTPWAILQSTPRRQTPRRTITVLPSRSGQAWPSVSLSCSLPPRCSVWCDDIDDGGALCDDTRQPSAERSASPCSQSSSSSTTPTPTSGRNVLNAPLSPPQHLRPLKPKQRRVSTCCPPPHSTSPSSPNSCLLAPRGPPLFRAPRTKRGQLHAMRVG